MSEQDQETTTESFEERSSRSREKRKRQLRNRLIAAGLAVIAVVSTVTVVSLCYGHGGHPSGQEASAGKASGQKASGQKASDSKGSDQDSQSQEENGGLQIASQPATLAPAEEDSQTKAEKEQARKEAEEKAAAEKAAAEKAAAEKEAAKNGTTIHIRMVGDVILHDAVCSDNWTGEGYCFDSLFANVTDSVKEADLSIVNQESILGGTELGIGGYPAFNSPYEEGDALVNAGFKVVLQASNHTLDQGAQGVYNCLNYWATNHPDTAVLGIAATPEAASDIYVYEKDGFRVAVLNYTYGTNSYEELLSDPNTSCLLNLLEESRVASDIARAREMADFIVVCPHWGNEYENYPSENQQYWRDFFLSQGVDLVIGAHPHVIQPVEMVTDDSGHQMLVYYSLGNFVSNQSYANTMVGAMADVTIRKDASGVRFEDYSVEPLVTHKGWNQQSFTTYFLKDYTEEMAGQNGILQEDGSFSLQYCQSLCQEVFGDLYKG